MSIFKQFLQTDTEQTCIHPAKTPWTQLYQNSTTGIAL